MHGVANACVPPLDHFTDPVQVVVSLMWRLTYTIVRAQATILPQRSRRAHRVGTVSTPLSPPRAPLPSVPIGLNVYSARLKPYKLCTSRYTIRIS